MIDIFISIIPHKDQRYYTAGDWQINSDGGWYITVSEMGNWRFEFLVGLHELVECALCFDSSITQETVDYFDMNFKGDGEPGDDKSCPYYYPHQWATAVERFAAVLLGVHWAEYEAAINALSDH